MTAYVLVSYSQHTTNKLDYVKTYRTNLYERMNAHNLALFIDKFTK